MKNKVLKGIKKVDLNVQKGFLKADSKKLEKVDVFFKWVPIVSLLILDAFNKQPKDKLKDHLLQFAASEILLIATVQPLKNTFKRTRPNGETKSFPSDHTATSFLGSEMLRQELHDKQPLASYAGYVVSTGTAGLRLYHNKHWLSDVITGAAIGIVSAVLAPRLLDRLIYKINIQAAV